MIFSSIRKTTVALIIGTFCAACNGGGGGPDGTIIQGTLTQSGYGHTDNGATMSAKHAPGERIEDVKICILDQCSITDGAGQWGLNLENFVGGEVAITIDGHGIDSQATVSLPASALDVYIDLGRDGNVITIDKLLIDGEDHSGHDHGHS